jgi:hypothetical protein
MAAADGAGGHTAAAGTATGAWWGNIQWPTRTAPDAVVPIHARPNQTRARRSARPRRADSSDRRDTRTGSAATRLAGALFEDERRSTIGRISSGRADRGRFRSTTVTIASISKNPELSSMRDGVNACGVDGVSAAALALAPDLVD